MSKKKLKNSRWIMGGITIVLLIGIIFIINYMETQKLIPELEAAKNNITENAEVTGLQYDPKVNIAYFYIIDNNEKEKKKNIDIINVYNEKDKLECSEKPSFNKNAVMQYSIGNCELNLKENYRIEIFISKYSFSNTLEANKYVPLR